MLKQKNKSNKKYCCVGVEGVSGRLSFMSNKDAVVTLKEGSSESKLFLAEDNERQEPLRGIKSHLQLREKKKR